MLNSSAVFGLAGAGVALATDILYVGIVVSQHDDPLVGVVLVVAVAIAGAGVAAGFGALTGRRGLLWSSFALLVVLGILGVFSIGLPLLVAAGLTAVAARQA